MLVSNTIRKIINLSGLLVGWLMGSGQLAAGGPLAVVLIIAATRSLRVTRSCLLAQVGLGRGCGVALEQLDPITCCLER